MGLFDWFKKKNPKQLTEGERKEKEEDTTVETGQDQENESGANVDKNQGENGDKINNDNSKISFSIESSLREYDEWFQKIYHKKDETYGGPISIYRANNGESIISLNYNNADKKDSMVLAIVKFKNDGEENNKKITNSLDRMLSVIYEKRYSQIYDLKEYLTKSLDDIKSEYDIQFTNEGEAVLLNYDRKFIYTNRTLLLKKDNELEYEKLENDSKQEYNAFDIPDENSCYSGTITVTLPIEKCDLSKINNEQKKIILDQLEELYKSAVNIGIINGIQNNDMKYRILEQCKSMQENLIKTKYGEIIKAVNLGDSNNIQNNIKTIKKCAMKTIIETSLYYEDLIEEYVNDSQKYESTEEKRNMFSKVLETAKTEYFYRRINGGKTITNQTTFQSSKQKDINEQFSDFDER